GGGQLRAGEQDQVLLDAVLEHRELGLVEPLQIAARLVRDGDVERDDGDTGAELRLVLLRGGRRWRFLWRGLPVLRRWWCRRRGGLLGGERPGQAQRGNRCACDCGETADHRASWCARRTLPRTSREGFAELTLTRRGGMSVSGRA